MKPFNKAEALNGAPVVLRNGAKAVVGFEIPAEQLINSNIRDALHGYIVGPLNIAEDILSWKENGSVWISSEDEFDIVGMWEEPRKQATITFPAPLLNKPKHGETYYSFSLTGYVEEWAWENDQVDRVLLAFGAVFATKEDAQAFLDAMTAARA